MTKETRSILEEHKTFQEGASFSTDYNIIEQCMYDCPACAQERLLDLLKQYKRPEISCDTFLIPDELWQTLCQRLSREVKKDECATTRGNRTNRLPASE